MTEPRRDAAPDPRAQARSFGAQAGAYERGRPGYPGAALDHVLPPGATRVLDLGAGTGKLTRSLVARGLDVVAVEPDAGMRAEFERVLPEVEVLDGTAERIPLPDASVDAVLVAQAWHWMDPVAACPEVARVLRPGGSLGLLWNLRDTSSPWLAELDRILLDNKDRAGETVDARLAPPFDASQPHEHRWTATLRVEDLVDLVASRSYVITMPAAQRDELLAEVRRLGATRLAEAGALQLLYVTHSFRAQLP